MKRILLRARKSPFDVATPEATLEQNLIGNNAGNLIFSHAAWRILEVEGTVITADRFRAEPGDADRINERYDAYVIPLANAFRRSFEEPLTRLTRLIERLKIPVVVLGVGAQSNLDYEVDRLGPIDRPVRAFVRAVLDRSPSIGVRGEFTQHYLQSLGFRDVEVIGCPSMFLDGDRLTIRTKAATLEPDARVAINISPYVKGVGGFVMAQHARYPNLTYVAQDQDTLALMLWGESDAEATRDDPMPVHRSHPFFAEDRTRFFIDPSPWIEFLATCDFSFGTRIHGNIVSLMAGTPAYVLAHDSRTLELARYFEIPCRTLGQVSADLDAAQLYEEADYGPLCRGHAARFATFAAYLERHGLAHVFDGGDRGAAFDARIRGIDFPPAVRAATGPVAAKNRVKRWMRVRRRDLVKAIRRRGR